VAAGHAVLPGDGDWPISYDTIANAPDNALCVYNTDGRLDGRIMNTGEVVEHPGIEIKIRGTGSGVAYRKAVSLANFLDTICGAPVAIDAKRYILAAITRTTPVLRLGQEEGQQRFLYTINAILTVREN
jgi:hypothetical protein